MAAEHREHSQYSTRTSPQPDTRQRLRALDNSVPRFTLAILVETTTLLDPQQVQVQVQVQAQVQALNTIAFEFDFVCGKIQDARKPHKHKIQDDKSNPCGCSEVDNNYSTMQSHVETTLVDPLLYQVLYSTRSLLNSISISFVVRSILYLILICK